MYATLYNIDPFDANIGTNINFNWNGNQIFKIRCIIKENESGLIVYDNTISNMKKTFPIPKDSGLINGTQYICYLTVFDIDNKESDLQPQGTLFYCFTIPTFSLSISDGDIIKNQSYEIQVSYFQNESEELNNYNIYLYNYQKIVLQESGTIYDLSKNTFLLSNLQNATQYYVRAIGTTVHGMQIDTGYILFSVAFKDEAQIFSVLELNNLKEQGAIEIKSNILLALGIASDPKNIKYIDSKYIDLQNNSVTFSDGFETGNNFHIISSFYKPKLNKILLHFCSDKEQVENIQLLYHVGNFSDSSGEKAYFTLRILCNNFVKYSIQSNYVDKLSSITNKKYIVLISRTNNLYNIKAIVNDKE